MATNLPFGIRVAAGVVGTTFDHLVRLPGELPGMTVSFAGELLRTSMRVRQEIAELATRGDELLAPLIGGAQEHPAWATFDEDEDNKDEDSSTAAAGRKPSESGTDEEGSTSPNAEPQDPTRTLVETLTVEDAVDFADLADDAEAADEVVFSTSTPAHDGSAILADHPLTIAELKERLEDLDAGAIQELLTQEESGPNRAPYLTLLGNRLTTLQHENR